MSPSCAPQLAALCAIMMFRLLLSLLLPASPALAESHKNVLLIIADDAGLQVRQQCLNIVIIMVDEAGLQVQYRPSHHSR